MHERAAFEGEQVPAEEFRMEGRQAVLGVRQAEDKQRRLTWGGHELFQSFVGRSVILILLLMLLFLMLRK